MHRQSPLASAQRVGLIKLALLHEMHIPALLQSIHSPSKLKIEIDTMTHPGNSRPLKVEIISIVFLVVSWIAVLLRCYVRRWISRAFRIDDWLMLLSVVDHLGSVLVSILILSCYLDIVLRLYCLQSRRITCRSGTAHRRCITARADPGT